MTSVTKNLLESSALVIEENADADTWKVKIISEGKGSSGYYSAELLDNHHHAFDNYLSFKNHPVSGGPQSRDFTMISGQIVGETWVETDEQGRKAVFGNYRADPEYKDKLARYRDKLGLSIYIEGEGHVEESTGDFMVDSFNPHDPYGSVDVVIAPGARGAFMESLSQFYSQGRENKPSATSVQEERKLVMEKDVEDRFGAIEALLNTLVADKKAKENDDAQVVANDEAVNQRVESITAGYEAIDAAKDELLPSQIADLRAEAKTGKDIAPLIEAAKKITAEAIAAIGDRGEGRVLGESKYESATDLGKVFG